MSNKCLQDAGTPPPSKPLGAQSILDFSHPPTPAIDKGGDVCHVRGSGDRAAGADVVREGTCKAHTERRHELSSEVWEMEV